MIEEVTVKVDVPAIMMEEAAPQVGGNRLGGRQLCLGALWCSLWVLNGTERLNSLHRQLAFAPRVTLAPVLSWSPP